LGGAAAPGAAKAQSGDRSIGQTLRGEVLERRLVPAIAAQAVKLQGVIAAHEIRDRVQVDGGGHARSVRSNQVQGVSLPRATSGWAMHDSCRTRRTRPVDRQYCARLAARLGDCA
jgi:hypothetical protein